MARTTDVLVASAKETIRAAAEQIAPAVSALEALCRELKAHPDFRKAETALRSRRPGEGIEGAFTLIWWLHNCVHGALEDLELGDVPAGLTDDARHAERRMLQFIEEDKQFHQARSNRAA